VPTLTLVAGPNGSGKSTLTRFVDFEGRDRMLDPDTIALGLNHLDAGAAAIAAGRIVLKRTGDYLDRGLTFAVETTLSSRNRVDLIRKAKCRGYDVHLVFIGLDSPERCITRIRNRAALGGHFIPDTDVRRRYARSIGNAAEALRTADVAKFYDNSGDAARLILVAKAGIVLWQAEPLPEWVRSVNRPQ
jgi:predicted ABC-type ATPase